MSKQQFQQEFKNLIKNTLLLEQADKNYFLENLTQLPNSALQYFYLELKPKNELVEAYLERAITDNPALINQFKQRVTKLGKQILALQEDEEKNPEKLEKLLQQKLNNL